MIIRPNATRTNAFKRWSVKDRREFTGNTLSKDISVFEEQIAKKDISSCLTAQEIQQSEKPAIDNFLKSCDTDAIIIIPSSISMTHEESKRHTVYSDDGFVRLNGTQVLRVLQDVGRIPKNKKYFTEFDFREYDISLPDLYDAAHHYTTDETLGVQFKGIDGRIRFFTFLNAIKGLEMQVFQNLAYYKHLDEIYEGYELNEDKRIGSKIPNETKVRRMKRYEQDTKIKTKIQPLLDTLPALITDAIAPQRKSRYNKGQSNDWYVFSQENPPARYDIQGTHIPRSEVPDGSFLRLALDCNCSDFKYSRNRSNTKHSRAPQENYPWCKHIIAAGFCETALTKNMTRGVREFPVPYATRQLIEFVDKLRTQAVVTHVSKNGHVQYNSPNKGTINRIVGWYWQQNPQMWSFNLQENPNGYAIRIQ